MPKVKKTKKTVKKRVKRAPKHKVLGTVVGRSLGFPQTMLFKHRYTNWINLNAGAGLAEHFFRANGLFDPDASGVGAQPMFYDQLTPIYGYYKVIGAKINVKFIDADDTTTVGSAAIGVYLDADTVGGTSWQQVAELKRGTHRVINPGLPQQDVIKNRDGLKSYFDAKKHFGEAFKGVGTGALNTTLPASQAYFVVYCQSIDGVSTVNMNAIVTIDYVVLWSQQITTVRS